MLQLLIHNYVLHTHIDTHIRAYVHGYTTAPCTRSTKADQLTVDLARRAHQSSVVLLMKTVREVSFSHSGQVRGRAAWWPSLCGSLFASRIRFTVDGERTACVLPVKSVTGLFVTLFSKSESRCRKEDAVSRLKCALEAVGGSLQIIPNSRPPFCL